MSAPFKLTHENYYTPEADRAYLTNSQRKTYFECQARWMAKLSGEWDDDPGEALIMGQYIDLALTEPDKMNAFLERYVDDVFMYGKTDKGKKKAWAELDEAIAVLRNEPVIMEFLTGSAQAMFCFDDFHGVPYRCKLDVLSPGRFITDLKSCKDVYETMWSDRHKERVSFIDAYDYWTQLSLYREAVRIATGETLPCYIVAIEKKAPYDRRLFELDDPAYMDGEVQFAVEVFREMQKHKESGITADELPRCERCAYCVSTKTVFAPEKITPRIRF